MSSIIDQDFPYDVMNRGRRDENRHNKKVMDAVKKQLKDIISQEDVITSAGNKKVKVKLKYLDEYRFSHHSDHIDNIGRDQFDELAEGELLQKPNQGSGGPGNGNGRDSQRGTEHEGELMYEAEFTVDQLTEMMLEDLELPDLDDKKGVDIVTEVLDCSQRRRRVGAQSLLDKKQTILSNIKRRSQMKENKPIPLINDDLVFKTWSVSEEKHSKAVIFLMMDRSGSMSDDKIYAVKGLYFWVVQFLRRRYDQVDIRFIAHDTIAREMDEKDFFDIATDGGTKISRAYEMCRDIIRHNYPAEVWNTYCFHASDGDSWSRSDDELSVRIVKEILALGAKIFCYTEIDIDRFSETNSYLMKLLDEASDSDGRIMTEAIGDKGDIEEVLKHFLGKSRRQWQTK